MADSHTCQSENTSIIKQKRRLRYWSCNVTAVYQLTDDKHMKILIIIILTSNLIHYKTFYRIVDCHVQWRMWFAVFENQLTYFYCDN